MQPRPNQRPTQTTHPRKVRGGVKLTRAGAAFPESWPAVRLIRLLEKAAAPATAAEGLQYARLGQTRQFQVEPGAIRGTVQGRLARAYETAVLLPAFNEEQWETVLAGLMEQPVYAARLTSGEVPVAFDEMLARRGLGLLPAEPEALRVTCTCADAARNAGRWCKHQCCVAYLLAERLAADPFILLSVRGMGRDELLERLRQRRALAGAGTSGVPVYSSHVSGVSDVPAPPLAEVSDQFWETPRKAGAALDLPVAPPEVSHPLLRRLGPSPFTGAGAGRAGASFPIVGLLATCYETISDAVIRSVEAGEELRNGQESRGSSPGPEPSEPPAMDPGSNGH